MVVRFVGFVCVYCRSRDIILDFSVFSPVFDCLMLAGIDDPKLDSAAFHPSSSSHSLPRRVICHPGHPALMIMGGLVLRLQCPGFVGRQSVLVSISEPPVSAVASVTAKTELQLRRHFRLPPKPEKLVSVGLYRKRSLQCLVIICLVICNCLKVLHIHWWLFFVNVKYITVLYL